MVTIRRIDARAHVRATEVPDRVLTAITNIFPKTLQEELVTTWTKVEAHSGIPMSIVTIVLEKTKACFSAFDSIIDNLPKPDRKTLSRTIEARLDDQCVFYLRLEKQEAFLERLKLAIGPDVISLQIHLQQYPRCKQDDVVEFLTNRLENVGGSS
jgi:RNA binding exosome subunit